MSFKNRSMPKTSSKIVRVRTDMPIQMHLQAARFVKKFGERDGLEPLQPAVEVGQHTRPVVGRNAPRIAVGLLFDEARLCGERNTVTIIQVRINGHVGSETDVRAGVEGRVIIDEVDLTSELRQ